tara:strand:+ start:32 stop:283 length:252 start_codon:yes stop_codon:yes gene_type:complete
MCNLLRSEFGDLDILAKISYRLLKLSLAILICLVQLKGTVILLMPFLVMQDIFLLGLETTGMFKLEKNEVRDEPFNLDKLITI